MLSRLWNWIVAKFTPRDRLDYWHPGERSIYSYFDGQKEVRADPIHLYKALMAEGPEFSANLKGASVTSKFAEECQKEVIAHVQKVFHVKPLTDGGLTDMECVDLLDHFLVWTQTVKKKRRPSPTSPETTSSDSPPPMGDGSVASSPVPPITPSTPDSGSTGTVPPIVPPPPSSPPLKSPLDSGTPESTTGETSPTEKEKP